MILTVRAQVLFLVGNYGWFVALASEIQEMDHPVRFVVEIFRVVQHQRVAHIDREVLPVKVVVPGAALWHHEEPEELVGQNQLDLLVHSRAVVWRVRLHGLLLVLFGPFHASARQLVYRERARARREATSSDN